MKECEVTANLRRRCSELETEARDTRAKVATLEKRVSDLVQEAQEQNTAIERYQGEVIRVETLLTQRDLALYQAKDDLAEARG
jgi:chromosome segregation ATPase